MRGKLTGMEGFERFTLHTGNGYYRVPEQKIGELKVLHIGQTTTIVGDIINHLGELEDKIEKLLQEK